MCYSSLALKKQFNFIIEGNKIQKLNCILICWKGPFFNQVLIIVPPFIEVIVSSSIGSLFEKGGYSFFELAKYGF